MAAERLFTSLSESGIVGSEGEDIELTEEFRAAVSATRERLLEMEEADIEAELSEHSEESATERLAELAGDHPQFVASFLEAAKRVDGLSPEEQVKITAIVQQLQTGLPPSTGTPDGFFEVAGQQLDPLLALNEKAIVYVWRDNCDPCEPIREDLETLLDDPDDIALLSVYGPDCPRYLQENYDVVAAPTVLFAVRGEIDSRLQGPHPTPSYEGEIEYLREELPA